MYIRMPIQITLLCVFCIAASYSISPYIITIIM